MTNHELSDAIHGKLSDDMQLGFKPENGIFNRLDSFICSLRINEPEICICAGLLLDDGRIIRGHRHDGCMQTFAGMHWTGRVTQEMQGFVTSRNRWVSREEGSALQNAAGIVSVMTKKPINGMLFSEDLY